MRFSNYCTDLFIYKELRKTTILIIVWVKISLHLKLHRHTLFYDFKYIGAINMQ